MSKLEEGEMCGIAGGFDGKVEEALPALAHRGRDASAVNFHDGVVFGHTRLAVIDLDQRSNQPFKYGSTMITYNGEMWNYKELRKDLEKEGLTFRTSGDTEVVAAALDQWGEAALGKFNGMFAVGWSSGNGKIFLARDRFGEVPVHYSREPGGFFFASEVKALRAMGCNTHEMLEPGTVCEASRGVFELKPYYDLPAKPGPTASLEEAAAGIRERLEAGVEERTISDVPVCALLSGGVDSSAIVHLLAPRMPGLVAYTAVLNKNSRDLKCARAMAKKAKVELREVEVPVPTDHDLASVIHTIEMPHKAQVEIGWACTVLARRIAEDGFKVVYSGEGSDELWASYGFAYHGIKKRGWHDYRKELFLSQARKNFARCNKIFMGETVECRLPFLNRGLVEYAIALPKESVVGPSGSNTKFALQTAFANDLPEEITLRAKVAFQDGMGLKDAIAESLEDPRAYYSQVYLAKYGVDQQAELF